MGTYENERPDNYPDQRDQDKDGHNPHRDDGGYEPHQDGPGGYDPHHGGPGGYDPHHGGPGGHEPHHDGPGGYDPHHGGPGGYDPHHGEPGGHEPHHDGPGGHDPHHGGPGGHEPHHDGPGGYDPHHGGPDCQDPHQGGPDGHPPHQDESGCHDYPPPPCQEDHPRVDCDSYIDVTYFNELEARHGRVTLPPSRSQFLFNENLLAGWEANETEGGKNFPDLNGGSVPPPFQADVWAAGGPADGFILSGGRTGLRDRINFTDVELNRLAPRLTGWPRLQVNRGQRLNVHWYYSMEHRTRGYRWFITRDNWNPQYRITRQQLDLRPFHEDINPWPNNNANNELLRPRVNHYAPIPSNKTGHHVLVMLWLVADTPNAFYQAFDVNIG